METAKKVGDVVVLPITSFSPGVQQMNAKEPDDPMAFVKHDFEGMFSSMTRLGPQFQWLTDFPSRHLETRIRKGKACQ